MSQVPDIDIGVAIWNQFHGIIRVDAHAFRGIVDACVKNPERAWMTSAHLVTEAPAHG